MDDHHDHHKIQNPPHFSSSENPLQNPNLQPISHEFGIHGAFPSSNYVDKMKNFKDFIFKSAASSSPTKSLSPSQKLLIEKRVEELFPDFHTPDHPPYATMISSAITTLKEDGGSTTEAISLFIKNKYTDLPRAHESFLKHHLEVLCGDRVVAKADDRFYMLNRGAVKSCLDDQDQDATRVPDFGLINHDDDAEFCSRSSPSPSPSPSPSSDSSWISSGSWNSSTSSDSFGVRKRGKKSKRVTRRRTRIYLGRAAKGRVTRARKALEGKESEKRTGRKKESQHPQGRNSTRKRGTRAGIKAGKEVQLSEAKETHEVSSSDILMLTGEAKESEERNDGRRVVVECRDPVTGKKRTVIDIDLDEIEDMVNEEQDLLERSVEKVNDQADVLGKQKLAQSHHFVDKEEQDAFSAEFELHQKAKAEESQPQAQEMEAELTEDLILEKKTEVPQQQIDVNKEGETMVIEEKIRGNECETLGCGEAAEDFKRQIHQIAKVKASEEQHNLVKEVQNEVSEEPKKPLSQQNPEEAPVAKMLTGSNTKQEIEEAEIRDENTHEEAGKEETTKTSEFLSHFSLQEPNQQLEEEEILRQQKRDSPAEEGNEEISPEPKLLHKAGEKTPRH